MSILEQAKRTALMKLEASALFANVKAQASGSRWWYFEQMRILGHEVRIEQRISAYRASLSFDYQFCGIECMIFLEKESTIGRLGENTWMVSISGIEGKVKALTIADALKPLQAEGYYLPNGNENLERQMNFSLGLYGACMMHVDIHFPSDKAPLPCFVRFMDLMDAINRERTDSLEQNIKEAEMRQQESVDDSDPFEDDVMMGDWQTWK